MILDGGVVRWYCNEMQSYEIFLCEYRLRLSQSVLPSVTMSYTSFYAARCTCMVIIVRCENIQVCVCALVCASACSCACAYVCLRGCVREHVYAGPICMKVCASNCVYF